MNRHDELRFLESQYTTSGSSLVIVYGRRRIGKTHVLKAFVQHKPALYFLATEEPERENLINFTRLVASFTQNALLSKGADFSWDDVITVFRDYQPHTKKILIIDEFQYLGKVNNAFPSVFQRIWDTVLKESNVMVVLCGSLINMMESQTLSHESPLYGRRTGQIRMKQIPFLHYGEFFPTKSEVELIEYYAVTGGVPKYVEAFQGATSVYDAIKVHILTRQSYLYEEPLFLLEKEVSETASYFAIIKTIAQGHHKLAHIAAALAVPQTRLTKYLATLISLDLVARQVPITDSNPEKSKKGLYFLTDNFIEFWFKFVYPYRSFIEMGDLEYVINKIRTDFVPRHVSNVFERVCLEKLWQKNRLEELPFKALKIGRWWSGAEEIDLIGLNEDSKEALFCECKYTEAPVDDDTFYALLQKAKSVEWHNSERREYYALCSKSGFTARVRELAERRKDIVLVEPRQEKAITR